MHFAFQKSIIGNMLCKEANKQGSLINLDEMQVRLTVLLTLESLKTIVKTYPLVLS